MKILNNKGSAFFVYLGLIGLTTSSVFFTELNQPGAEQHIRQLKNLRKKVNEIRAAIRYELAVKYQADINGDGTPEWTTRCTQILKNKSINESQDLGELTFSLMLPYINSKELHVGSNFKGGEISAIRLEPNQNRLLAEGPKNTRFATLTFTGQANGSPRTFKQKLHLTYQAVSETEPLKIQECTLSGHFIEKCWLTGLDTNCNRNQWMAVKYSQVCHAFTSIVHEGVVGGHYPECREGSDPHACCDPNSGHTSPFIQNLWATAFPSS